MASFKEAATTRTHQEYLKDTAKGKPYSKGLSPGSQRSTRLTLGAGDNDMIGSGRGSPPRIQKPSMQLETLIAGR